MKFISIEFESVVAEYYVRKAASVKQSNLAWRLSLVSVRNLMRTVICPYTGVKMTVPLPGRPLPTDFTIDRIDNSKGYIPGNVMAISRAANNFKSIFENPQYPLDMATATVALARMNKRVSAVKSQDAQKKQVIK